jgi:CRISPR/Cas system-associated exonuclease Cas4 (RecB family)
VIKRVGVVDDLKKYIAWLNSADGERIQGVFELGFNGERGLGLHPSAIAKKGVCPLKHYFDCTGEIVSDEVFSSQRQLIFDMGTVMHSMLQTLLVGTYWDGNQFEPEIPLPDTRLLYNSHTDGRFVAPSYSFLTEIKSCKEGGSSGWERVQRSPLRDNVRQLMQYMYIDDTPFGLLLYFCKNNSCMKEWPIAWDEELWAEIEEEALPIVEAVEAKERPTPKVGSHCRDCGYLQGCKRGKEHVDGVRAKRRAIRRSPVRR